MKYEVVPGRHGKDMVRFQCPACLDILESPLDEAGQSVACPNCSAPLTTPGITELQKRTDAAAKTKQEREAAIANMTPPIETDEAEEALQVNAWAAKQGAESPPAPAETAPTLDYLIPRVEEVPTLKSQSAPSYTRIIQGAKTLELIAQIVAAIGWVGIVIGALILCAGLAKAQNNYEVFAAFIAFAASMLTAVIFLAAAALIRMNASLALAVRDIARNTFDGQE